ncbi:MAG: VCBS repeat-containing protein, partial [Chitinophagaceae bacterium]
NLCADLENIGMVTDAVWSDVNKDGWLDLVIAGEWMPVTVLLNKKGQLTNVTEELGLSEFTGLWISLKMADINNDGLDDILVGNLGENSKLPASKKFPLVMYLGDFDNNTYPEQILSSEKNGLYYPFLGKDELQKVVPGVIRKRYPDYKMFAGQTVEEIFEGQLRKSKKLAAATLSSMVFVNRNGKYQPIDLPGEIQWAPVYCWFTGDLNQNGLSDILAGGNLKNVPPYEGSYDAGYGTLLEGKGNRVFTAMTMLKSGIDIKGQVRDIKSIRMAKGRRVLAVALNNDKIKFFE